MKRDAYGEDGPSSFKKPRNDDDEVCFLIPSKVAGSIIGKGGVNISKLRNQYKAQISIPDCPGPERVLSISAADIDTTVEIVKEILPKLSDPTSRGGDDDDLDARLLIHQSRAGCVIGKGGSKIKELREKTGARLKIFSSPAPQSTERVVQLLGRDDAIAAGVKEVLELTRQTPIKGAVAAYDPHNYDDFYADEYGGFGVGQGGPPPGAGRGGPPRPPRGMPMGPGGPGGPGRGPPPPRGGPMLGRNGPPGAGPRPPFNEFSGPPSGPSGPRPGFGGPSRGPNFSPGNFGNTFGTNRGPTGGDGGGFGNGGGDNQEETSTQVTIPKDLAGAIIGRAGLRIRKIRAESGAEIEIAEPLPGAAERIITITGAPPQIQMAQYLLQQSVHENHPNLARGNY